MASHGTDRFHFLFFCIIFVESSKLVPLGGETLGEEPVGIELHGQPRRRHRVCSPIHGWIRDDLHHARTIYPYSESYIVNYHSFPEKFSLLTGVAECAYAH